jgi:amino acid adenylation domain-containing protein
MSVLNIIEERMISQPDAVAVSFAGRRVTYAQLNTRANQVACTLRAAGVVPESLVAIYLERSPDLVAGLLGVWKAGGAYLPIDPTNPQQRVAFTLEDSQVPYILTERSLLGTLPPTTAKVICVEDLCNGGLTNSPKQIDPEPDQLAYVIYTSGSTGRPKGAQVCHGGLLNVVRAIGSDLALRPRDVVLATATIAFDISNLELYVPLTAGATIHMMDTRFAGDGPKLIDMIRNTNAALVFGTPTSWRLMLEAGWQGSKSLQIITGGETLPLSLANTLTEMTRAVWNHYGPTETSICATREQVLPNAELITLGLPIENVRIYVLDEELKPCAVGETGEIFIAGVGVGRGYLNRPELTEQAFIPDPFAETPGARMYKTGDLGRMLPDGRLDFQGRADNQIKLRGFRIELEEIESAVREYTGVHAAVVQLVEYGPDDQRLVGYYLSDHTVTENELRNFLRQRLPHYMLPTEMIPLESLPMTVNGKVDREALDMIRIQFEAQAQAQAAHPSTDDLETKLLAIWQRLLKVRTVRPTDDFFDLGGHSLLATRMFAEIEKITGRKIPLSVLIQNPTVQQLTTYIHTRLENGWPGLVQIQPGGSQPPLFLAHGLGSSLLVFRTLADDLGPDQPVYGIQLAADTDARIDDLMLEAFAARYVEEIVAIDPIGPYYLAGHSLGGLLVFEIASQLRAHGKEVGLLALLDCNLHVAQRAQNTPKTAPVPFADKVTHWKRKFSRLSHNGMIDTIWRKVLYNQLMVKIWALRRVHREGTFYPHIFGLDPYIALFAERYQPQPIDQDAVLFVAEEQLSPESVGLGWLQVIKGRLDIQKIPGAHQTIFTRPHVTVLAREMAKRLDLSARSTFRRRSPRRIETPAPAMKPELEFQGG